VEILHAYAERAPSGKSRRIALRFLLSPVEILGDERVQAVNFARNELVADAGGSPRARATPERIAIPADAVFRAIGYRGTPLPGVPFDERRLLIANDGGRVQADGGWRRGEYVVGWAKRGPSGVIGTNKKDAAETVAHLLEDLAAGRLPTPPPISDAALEAFVRSRQPALVDHAGWLRIDRHERERGEALARPRVKLTRIEEMLDVARGENADGPA
jgi:ferredoxin--NADP+ reductase